MAVYAVKDLVGMNYTHITAVCHYCGGNEMAAVHYMDAVKCVKCDAKYTITGLKASWNFKPSMTRDKAIALNNGA